MNNEITHISSLLEDAFSSIIQTVPSFKVLDEDILPYGLKQHTRSVCWLAEQVLLQNTRKNSTAINLSEYEDPVSDTSAWDARLKFAVASSSCYVNIKVSDVTKPVRVNDIASVKKLINFYDNEPDALLYYVVIMLKFDKNTIHFVKKPIVRHYPWIGEFLVNRRNHHIQAYYETPSICRTTEEFLHLIKGKANDKNVAY
jgi:hypothetical protein